MNPNTPATFVTELLRDLRTFAAICENALALATREHQALSGTGDYQPFEFSQLRKDLLGRLGPITSELRQWRQLWQQCSQTEREGIKEVKSAIQMLQDLIIKFFQLDRENQQALLRRGLVPARHVTSCAAPPSNYVSSLYRRNTPH
jgi:hypothetical protein